MIANQTLDLLGNLAPAQQALGLSVQAPKPDMASARFDAALLDAAKLLRDNSLGNGEKSLLPKVQAALEAALAELNERPLDQLQALAQRPEVLKQASQALSQAFGLEPGQNALLERALQRGLEGLTAYAARPSLSELRPAEQADALGGPAVQAHREPAEALAESGPYSIAALSQGVLVPVLVSTRTDGASGPESANSLSKTAAPQAVSGTASAPALQVTVSGKGAAPQAAAAQALQAPASAPAGSQPLPGQVQVQGTLQASGRPAVQAQGDAKLQADGQPKAAQAQAPGSQGKAQPAAEAPLKAQAQEQGVSKAAAPALKLADPGLSFELKAPSAPVAVQAESLVTLREDGTWVIPEQKGPVPAAAQASSAPAAALPATVAQAPAVLAAAPASAAPAADPELEESAPAPVRDQAGLPKRVFETASQTGQPLYNEGLNGLGDTARHALRQEALRETVFSQVGPALQDAASRDQSRMVIRLRPAQLGDVTVDLSLVDGKLSARLVASDSEVRDAFVRDLAAFKGSLEAAGVTVKELSVAVKAQTQDPGQGSGQQAFDWRQAFDEVISDQGSSPVLVPAAASYNGSALGSPLRFSALA